MAFPAAAYLRTTTGYLLFWSSRKVEFVVNKKGTGDFYLGCTGGPTQSIAAAEAAFKTWTEATLSGKSVPCTDFEFVPLEPTDSYETGYDGVNRVVWRQGDCDVSVDAPCHEANTCGNADNCWDNTRSISSEEDTLALTTVSYIVTTGEIVDADIELHGWNGSSVDGGYYYTCVAPGADPCANKGDPNCIGFDVQNVVTHEVGHVLGLGDLKDSADQDATMYYQAGSGETSKRDLAADDINGMCATYPRGKPTPTSMSASRNMSGGCGAGDAGSAAMALVGAYALLHKQHKNQ
jgi:hypothetical protein